MLMELFLTFARIGLFTFGGGYAMLSLIEHICVEERQWITQDDMMNITVIAESTPGPIAVNCATFVGYKQRGLAGAVAATLGVVFPSFVIIALLALMLDQSMQVPLVANAFKGIRIATGLLILDAAIKMFSKMPKKPLNQAIVLCAAAAMLIGSMTAVHVSSIVLMLLAGAVGLLVYVAGEKRKGEK